MKNKFTARLCVLMCIILAISCFSACKVKPDNTGSTTLAGGDSWQSDSGYNKVVISQAELVDLVEDALGDDMPENFNGNLNTLTPEQLEKVEDYAKDEGLTVEKDDNGDTVIKKEEIPVTEASKDEVEDLFNKLSIKDPSNLSDKEIEELSKAAGDEGLIIQTKPDGNVVVVKPVTTTRIITQAPKETTAKVTKPKTTKGTTSVYKPPQHVTAAPIGSSTQLVVSTLSDGWITNFGNGKHTVLVDNAVAKDGGTVAVGVASDEKVTNAGVVVKYNEKGKQQWTDIVSANELVSLEGITVLKDGSIVVVGSTLSTDLTSADNYMCPNTVEGVVIKYSEKGDRQWIKIIGGSGSDILYAVEATPDGGFVIGGKSTSKDGHLSALSDKKTTKAFVMKFDENGNPGWINGLAGTIHCTVKGIAVNPAGEVFTTMENNNTDGDFAQFNLPGTKRMSVVSKFSSSGKLLWTKPLYESGLTNMHGITYTDDGGCVVAGQYSVTAKEGNIYSFSQKKGIYNGGTGGTYDGIIVKFKTDGSTSWMTPLVGFESDFITDITRISNGYAVCGYSASSNRDFQGLGKGDYDAYIYTLNNYGETEKVHSFSGSAADNARTICASGDLLYVAGSTNSSDGAFEGLTPAGTADNAAGIMRCYKLS